MHIMAAAAATPSLSANAASSSSALGTLRPDPGRILDLPAGFSYSVVSRAGDEMVDGLRVPQAHDGMAAFAAADGRVILVCNHELEKSRLEESAFDSDPALLPEFVRNNMYDAGNGVTPLTGGTTTTLFNPATGKTERQHLSLAGTENNCAGGKTPWGTWLSCEECFTGPGTAAGVHREKTHGYVFEVAAAAQGLANAQPIKALGRFEHEAAAVHAASGIVYLTEDQYHSLFYRFLPNVPGRLSAGGRLQALAVTEQASLRTHNWSSVADVRLGEELSVSWIDLDDVDSDTDDLRERGAKKGAAMFARGEGLCTGEDFLAFTCTIGGHARLGQVFTYLPSEFEGTAAEAQAPGKLVLTAEADQTSLLRNADNIVVSPWGDLVICEDTSSHCGLVGIDPNGVEYMLADNPYSGSELAGVCFSPDGQNLFVNIQYPGMTLAITGPWPAA